MTSFSRAITPATTIRICLSTLIMVMLLIGLSTVIWTQRTAAQVESIETRAREYHHASYIRTSHVKGNLSELRAAIAQHRMKAAVEPSRYETERSRRAFEHRLSQIVFLIDTEGEDVARLQEHYDDPECGVAARRFAETLGQLDDVVHGSDGHRAFDAESATRAIEQFAEKNDQLHRLHNMKYEETMASLPRIESERRKEFYVFLGCLILVSTAMIGGLFYSVETVIARQTESEARARDGELRLRRIADALPVVIAYVDRDERYQFINAAYESWFERPISESLGKRIGSDLGEVTYAKVREQIASAMTGHEVSFETKFPIAADGVRPVNLIFIPHFDETGEVMGLFALITDLSEQKESESALIRAKVRAETAGRELARHQGRLEMEVAQRTETLKKMHLELLKSSHQAGMAEVATGVLHNVGNVLNSVNVSAGIVADKSKNSRAYRLADITALLREHHDDLGDFLTTDPKGKNIPEYLEKLAEHLSKEQDAIVGEANTLAKNVAHIKHVISMQQSAARISSLVESISLPQLVDDAMAINSDSLKRQRIEVQREYAIIAPVKAQKHKVLQILVNLISNARHAIEECEREGGQITLRVSNGGSNAVIEVADTGTGIPEENLTRIFSHGFTTKETGHGFGLHSSAVSAQEMGGSLHAKNNENGPGVTFVLELPYEVDARVEAEV